MAHVVALPKLECRYCHKPATHRVFNSVNAPIGEYCSKHAAKRLAEIQTLEASANRQPTEGQSPT